MSAALQYSLRGGACGKHGSASPFLFSQHTRAVVTRRVELDLVQLPPRHHEPSLSFRFVSIVYNFSQKALHPSPPYPVTFLQIRLHCVCRFRVSINTPRTSRITAALPTASPPSCC
jgi:hypothetical protein